MSVYIHDTSTRVTDTIEVVARHPSSYPSHAVETSTGSSLPNMLKGQISDLGY